jgi:Ion channel
MLILQGVVVLLSVVTIAIVLWDGFETVVLPRRVARRLRLTAVYNRGTWHVWSAVARKVASLSRRESLLAVFGPLALLLLLALWATLLILAYGLLYWGLGSTVSSVGNPSSLGTDLYFSGTTLLTLGLGDALPHTALSRMITVVEVGNGFALLAVVIGYVPVLYQAFSRRETRISLLDAHAGSPPSAGTLLSRDPPDRRGRRLAGILSDWEGWSAELLESHLSYPVMAYYRSQHENQSWVAALTVILDACALVLACGRGLVTNEELAEQAAFTFAMARHAAVDLARVFRADTPGRYALKDRLPDSERARLRSFFRETGLANGASEHKVEGTLDQIRGLYEPYVAGLSEYLLMPLPPWIPDADALDDWQTTADGITSPSIAGLVRLRFTEPMETPNTVTPPSC